MVWLGLIAIVLAGWYAFERSKRKTHAMAGGLREDITLPHEQEWELYHNSFSLCSKKARVCLAELGIPYASHHIDLIETGSYETLSREYLAVNPAALVPVLVHNGHPIYESHEQIEYAAAHSRGAHSLNPSDAQSRERMQHWVYKSSLVGDDPISNCKETAGNAVAGLTAPLFATMIRYIAVRKILPGVLFHRLKERPLLFLVMKLLGPQRAVRIRRFAAVTQACRKAMQGHLNELERTLGETGGPWICGEQFTLADVGMMVILDRLQEADWTDLLFAHERPLVANYWQALKARPSYRSAVTDATHPLVIQGSKDIARFKASDPQFHAALLGTNP